MKKLLMIVLFITLCSCGPEYEITQEYVPPEDPVLVGIDGVSNPVLIESTKVEPEYPKLAREARVDGQVLLQVLVNKYGYIDGISVIRVNRPNLGFETSAISAVSKWRYEPAMQNGKPVKVYFTIVVDFSSENDADPVTGISVRDVEEDN